MNRVIKRLMCTCGTVSSIDFDLTRLLQTPLHLQWAHDVNVLCPLGRFLLTHMVNRVIMLHLIILMMLIIIVIIII